MDQTRAKPPDVIVAGFMKSGTTSLYRWLTAQPGVAAGRKEPDFFSINRQWAKGLGWYAEELTSETKGLTVDASTSYGDPSLAEVASERAAAINPSAQLIVVVRDPLSRAVSHLAHERQRGRETIDASDLASTLTPESIYIRCSRYYTSMTPWFERFPAKNILVVATSCLDNRGWPAIADHLGLASDTNAPAHDNVTSEKQRFTPLMARLYRSRSIRKLESALPSSLKKAVRPLLFQRDVDSRASIVKAAPVESIKLMETELADFEALVATRGIKAVGLPLNDKGPVR